MRRLHPIDVCILPGCRDSVSAAELRRIARGVLRTEDISLDVGVEAVLADSGTVQNLNRLYRGRDEPADVLSFAAHEGEAFIDAPGEAQSLGEVIVCVPVAKAQAEALGRPVAGEIAHLLVHGLLHILGYDHEEDAAGQAMKQREDEILERLGYAGQYAHGH